MLVWINGPFGGGKTQTAFELHRRLPGSVVCDPEYLGFGLHRMLPRELRSDFQDFPAWRQGVYDMLDLVASRHVGTVLVPMTLIEPDYFTEIIGRLRASGHDVRHFALLAARDTAVRRLRERVIGRALGLVAGQRNLRQQSFALAMLDLCLERLAQPMFAEQVWTNERTVPEVAEFLAARCGLSLTRSGAGRVRGRMRRVWVGARHIRLR